MSTAETNFEICEILYQFEDHTGKENKLQNDENCFQDEMLKTGKDIHKLCDGRWGLSMTYIKCRRYVSHCKFGRTKICSDCHVLISAMPLPRQNDTKGPK